ncbi:hypothetical protein FHW89_002520 [Mucilaginibacter sp. SG564]|nr:hypothetical protein [Mucilaginibacter sp. SG564]
MFPEPATEPEYADKQSGTQSQYQRQDDPQAQTTDISGGETYE